MHYRSDMRMFLQHFLFCLIFTAAGRGELKDYKKLRSCRWMIPSSYAAIGVMEDCTVVVLSPEYEDNTSPPELARNNKSCAGAQIIMIKSLVLYKEGKMKTVHFPVAFVNPHFIPISLGCDFPMKKMIYFCNLSDDFVPNTRFKVEEDAALTIHGNAISVGSHRVVLNEDGKILHYDHMTEPETNDTETDYRISGYKVVVTTLTTRTIISLEGENDKRCLLFVHHPRVAVKRWTFVKEATYDQLVHYQQQRKEALLDLPYLLKPSTTARKVSSIDPFKQLFNDVLYCLIGVQICIIVIPGLYAWCFGCPCSGESFAKVEYERMNKDEAVQKKQAAKKQAELLREQRLRAQKERMLRDSKGVARARAPTTKDAFRVKGLSTVLPTKG
uniref:Uncharacterized protein n=1 Tax=Parascaris univalens TaxID=6257 RepID=A0A915AWK9_PARUN